MRRRPAARLGPWVLLRCFWQPLGRGPRSANPAQGEEGCASRSAAFPRRSAWDEEAAPSPARLPCGSSHRLPLADEDAKVPYAAALPAHPKAERKEDHHHNHRVEGWQIPRGPGGGGGESCPPWGPARPGCVTRLRRGDSQMTSRHAARTGRHNEAAASWRRALCVRLNQHDIWVG